MAATVRTAMAHDIPIRGITTRGMPFAGMVKRTVLDESYKVDPKVPDRSSLSVVFDDGTTIRLDEMADLALGT